MPFRWAGYVGQRAVIGSREGGAEETGVLRNTLRDAYRLADERGVLQIEPLGQKILIANEQQIASAQDEIRSRAEQQPPCG